MSYYHLSLLPWLSHIISLITFVFVTNFSAALYALGVFTADDSTAGVLLTTSLPNIIQPCHIFKGSVVVAGTAEVLLGGEIGSEERGEVKDLVIEDGSRGCGEREDA